MRQPPCSAATCITVLPVLSLTHANSVLSSVYRYRKTPSRIMQINTKQRIARFFKQDAATIYTSMLICVQHCGDRDSGVYPKSSETAKPHSTSPPNSIPSLALSVSFISLAHIPFSQPEYLSRSHEVLSKNSPEVHS